ncbi:MAG: hypothetical protein ACPGF7_09390 [Pontibacterium sp.]
MKYFVGVLVVALLAVVGDMDYADAEQQLSNYCDMVNQGHWPNYEGLDCVPENSIQQ